jgi:hypothetical protein
MANELYRSLTMLQTLFNRRFKMFKTFKSFKPPDDFGVVLNGLNGLNRLNPLFEGIAETAGIGYEL